MSNPTRQEIIDAYQELDMLLGFYDDRNPYRVPECRRIIEKALPPRPQPTMAEVEWDDEKYYLAEAEAPKLGKVAMLRKTGGLIEFIMKPYTPQTKGAIWPEKLTPTGKRYTLTEVQDD
ncbi:hypothetical protein [Corynebacterium striatum]|uniref:hypothetical protein n=1 Tax=Corynebacterium striatum TaxID=43770 RepID=UPI000668870A|nr:hypothetical protein [Corynebacterium striatum]EGT5575723.1 hypothetical protein [Corynebacterium striatum]CQD13379.1 conserved hypothetical protein [Corynebacterium striatum]